eukprot:COSAG02_NODE_25085_length_669_cov_1.177193_1_plen_54_part_10
MPYQGTAVSVAAGVMRPCPGVYVDVVALPALASRCAALSCVSIARRAGRARDER